MKKYLITIVLALAACLSLAAQSDVEKLKAMARNNRVAFDYAVYPDDSPQVRTSGSAIIDGECFLITGNGFVVYCDGTTKWSVDGESKEVYIESAGSTKDYFANPDKWLDCVTGLVYKGKTVSGKYADPDSGDLVSFKFSSLTSMPKGSASDFVPDLSDLGSGWVTTDLR